MAQRGMSGSAGAGGPARIGAVFGVGLGALAIVVTALYDTGHVPRAVEVVEYLVVVAGILVAGYRGARASGGARGGAVAGLVAAVVPGIVLSGSGIVAAMVAPATYAGWYGYHDMTGQQLLVAAVVQAVVGVIVWAVIGTILGVVAGLFGRGRAQARVA